MTFNKYETYSIISTVEHEVQNQKVIISELIENLNKFLTANEIIAWLKSALQVYDDTQYLYLAKNYELYFSTTSNFYNVTLKYNNVIKSYNFLKN